MILALVWKEWREHWWKMAALVAMMLVPVMAMRLWGSPMLFGGGRLDWAVFVLAWAGAVWIAAFDVSGERARGTALLLQALPGGIGWAFWIRTGMGLLTLLMPLGLVYWFTDGRRARTFVEMAVPMVMTALYVYCILRALTAGARREGLVAATGVLVMLGLVLAGALVDSFVPYGYQLRAVGIVCPLLMETEAGRIGAVVALQGAICLVLCGVAYVREAWEMWPSWERRPPVEAKASREVECLAVDGGLEGAYPLVWKEWREQRALIIGMGIGAALTAGVIAMTTAASRWHYHDARQEFARTYFEVLTAAGAFAPSLLAIALGIGAFTEDLQQGIGGFWRTRPVAPQRLLAAKLGMATVGLATMLALMVLGMGGTALMNLLGYRTQPFEPYRMILGQLVWLPMVLMLSTLAMVWMRWTLGAAAVAVALTLSVACFPTEWYWGESFGTLLMYGKEDATFGAQAAGLLLAAAGMGIGVKWGFERSSGWRG